MSHTLQRANINSFLGLPTSDSDAIAARKTRPRICLGQPVDLFVLTSHFAPAWSSETRDIWP
jgi:hypothetical protein